VSELSSELCAECGGRATTNHLDYTFTTTCAALPFEGDKDLVDQLIQHLVISPRVPRDPAEFFAAPSHAQWVDGEPIADAIRRHPTLAGRALDWMCSQLVIHAIPFDRPWSRDRIPPYARDVYDSYPMLSLGTGELSRAWIYRSLSSAYTIVDEVTRARFEVAPRERMLDFDRTGSLAPGLTQELADCTTEVAYKLASNGAFGAEWTMGRMATVLFAEGIPYGVGFPRWPNTFAWANL